MAVLCIIPGKKYKQNSKCLLCFSLSNHCFTDMNHPKTMMAAKTSLRASGIYDKTPPCPAVLDSRPSFPLRV